MRILFTGGGTGGHFFPVIAVIQELKRVAEEERILDLEFFYMGATFGKEGNDLLKQEGVLFIPVLSGKQRRYFSLLNIIDMFKLAVGILQSLWNMYLVMPDVVFSKGGYAALPVVFATAFFRVPLVIHESDSVPGKVSTFSARFAKRIGIGFGGAAEFFPKEKTALVGVPIRKHMLGGLLDEAKESLNIFSRLPVIGFIGASQGAEKLNQAVFGIIKELTDEFEILNQTGEKNYKGAQGEGRVALEFAHNERYHPFSFLNEGELRDFYSASDIIVSRASASSVFEIAAWAKPSILVPLKNAAQDHQRKNAYEYASSGATVVIEETNLKPHILFAEIKKLVASPERMKQMSLAAQKFSRIDSAEVIAKEILSLGLHK